jgi:hypothetical protein
MNTRHLSFRIQDSILERGPVESRMVSYLVVIGIIGSWCAWIILSQLAGAYDEAVNPKSKPAIYYICYGIGIMAVISAGVLAAMKGQYGRLNLSTRIAFWLLQIAGVTWALVAYNWDDLISWKVLGSTGPFIWLTCITVFAGMERSVWRLLEPLIRFISYATAIIALYTMIAANFTLDERVFSSSARYMVLLMWFGGWTLITSWPCSVWRLGLRSFPYVVFVISTIFTQTRSWMLMSIVLLLTVCLISKPKLTHSSWVKRLTIILVVVSILLLAWYLLQEPTSKALDAFANRAYEDTRTAQYSQFFSQVPLTDLILGRGPLGTWDWNGEEYQYFDNAYLWMAFIGGLPILISYTILIILPGIRAFLNKAQDNDAASAILVIMWGLACTGFSTYSLPSLTPHNFLIALFAGRCLRYLTGVQHVGSIPLHDYANDAE